MCIAIYKSTNCKIDQDHLHNSFLRNSDGAGFAVAKNGKLLVRKGFMSFDDFLAAYNADVSDGDSALVHFRIKTAGKLDAENCHPWAIGDYEDPEVAFIHNGTLTDFINEETGLSDTGNFRTAYLDKAYESHGYKFPYIGWINYSIRSIAYNSKLVFLDKDGDATIINEAAGSWHSGCWFSNESFKSPPINSQKSLSCGAFSGGIQAYRIKLDNGKNVVLHGDDLHKFLSRQHHLKGKNGKKLNKLVRAGLAELVSLKEICDAQP